MEMDWTQAVTIIGTNLAFIFGFVIFLLGRMDSSKRELEQKIESAQKDSNSKLERVISLMDSNQKENNAKFEAMNSRFNGLENRLTSMESEIKNVNQNLGQRIENTNQRIDNTNQRIDNTNQRITDLKTDMNQRLSTIEGYLVPKKVFHFEESHHKDDHEEPKEN